MNTLSPSFIRIVTSTFCALVVATIGVGCVSKSKAEAQARAAYVAGQQDAIARMQRNNPQGAGATVTFQGAVRQPVVPWTQNTTLASALLAADYFGSDPTRITILRGGRAINIEPSELLSGRDVQLAAGDIIHIQTADQSPAR
jgi:hypothetical protein